MRFLMVYAEERCGWVEYNELYVTPRSRGAEEPRSQSTK